MDIKNLIEKMADLSDETLQEIINHAYKDITDPDAVIPSVESTRESLVVKDMQNSLIFMTNFFEALELKVEGNVQETRKPNFELIERLIGEGIGEASMAWAETPKGVFDSRKCVRIVENLMELIRNEFDGK